MGKLKNYRLGHDGVNIVKDPLHLLDSQLESAQNAEFVPNQGVGGFGALSKRGGLAALNSALAGAIYGMVGVPLKTTYTRTLYAALMTQDSDTFTRSTDGTTWAQITTATRAAAMDKFTDNTNDRTQRRGVAFKTFLIYAGDNYTQDTDYPTLVFWDGTDAQTITTVPFGPSSNGAPAFCITDMCVGNGKVYLAVSDAGGSAPNRPGRVLELNITTGRMRQVATVFGGGTNEVDGGLPACLCFYQNQLFVGLNGENTTDGIGKVVRCYPDVDTAWTTDVSNLSSHPTSMCEFGGHLYVTTRASVATGARIYKRTVTSKAYSAVVTSGSGAGGSGHYGHIIVYSGSLYAVEYFSTTPVIHIVTSSDGASWSTSRDVDSADSGVAGNLPGGSVLYGSDLYFSFRATAVGAGDGFIMRRSGGSWTKVKTDNISGPLMVLLERS